MDFSSWLSVMMGCVALAMAILVMIPRADRPRNVRIIGSVGFALLMVGFFLLARSHVLHNMGRYYYAYLHPARSLHHISMGLAAIGIPFLCWWIVATLPPERTPLQVRRRMGYWFSAAVVFSWTLMVLLLIHRHSHVIRLARLTSALACFASLAVATTLYVPAWRQSRTPPAVLPSP